jgi:hypothetical protein
MARRYRDQTFRKTDFVRAVKAAHAAGIVNPRFEIDLVRRVMTVVPGDATLSSGDAKTGNPWDEVLPNVPHKA